MPFFSFLPPDASVRHVILHRAERFFPVCGAFTQEIMRGPSPLSVAEREVIAAFTSALNVCQYCTGAHQAFARDNGVDPALFASLLEDIDTAPIHDRMKPILRFVRKLTLTPSRMEQKDADSVFQAGWDEQALEDTIAVCALFNFYNRLVDGHGVRGTAAVWSRSAQGIRESGYAQFIAQEMARGKTG